MAGAIPEAAVKPTRATKVGALARMNTTIAKISPALGEKMSAKQVDRQQRDERPRNPEGTLYKAGEAGAPCLAALTSRQSPAEPPPAWRAPGGSAR